MFVSLVRYYKERPILYILYTYEFRINIRTNVWYGSSNHRTMLIITLLILFYPFVLYK